VLGLTATDVADRIRTDVVDIEDPRESLERGCRSFFEAALDPAYRQILLVDAPVVLGWNEWLGHDSAHSGRLLDDVINRLYADGRLGDVDPAAVTILLSGAMNEAALWVATARGDVEAAYAVLLRFIDSWCHDSLPPRALPYRELVPRARSTTACRVHGGNQLWRSTGSDYGRAS
jgi:hypothetical protein